MRRISKENLDQSGKEVLKSNGDNLIVSRMGALLEFYSSRATAHASFLVASVFGIVTFSAIIQQISTSNTSLYIVSIPLFLGFSYAGYLTLVRFGFYAEISHAISEHGLEEIQTLKKVQLKEGRYKNLSEYMEAKYKQQKQLLFIKREFFGNHSTLTRLVYYASYWFAIICLGTIVYSHFWQSYSDAFWWFCVCLVFMLLATIIPYVLVSSDVKRVQVRTPEMGP